MGAFLGSIHVRTDDREAVRAAVEKLARRKKAEFLLAPTLGGWTSIYPYSHGQDDSVSKALAKALPFDVVHVLVHDDDIFAYFFYRSGKLLDEYNSAPDYFEPVSARKKARLAGRPELLAAFLKDPGGVFELRRVLDEHRPFATETLERFALLLDLPNAATSYEYLLDGETDGIEAFEQFVRVPEATEEERQRAREKASFEAVRRDLQEQGLLLAELVVPKHSQWQPLPLWCAYPPDGFLLCLSTGGIRAQPSDTPLLHWTAPWTGEPAPLGIQVDSRAHALVVSPSGHYLAIGLASGQWSAQLWNLQTRNLIADLPASRAVQSLAFSPDEQLLAFRSESQVVLAEIQTGKPVATITVPGNQCLAIHPSGDYVVADHPEGLAIVEIPAGRLVSTPCLGRPDDTSDDMTEEALKMFRGMMKKLDSQLEKMRPELSQLEPESREQIKRQIEQWKHAAETGSPPGQLGTRRHPDERAFRIAFNADGKDIFLGTNAGARVYSWEALLATEEYVPIPRLAADAKKVPCEVHGQVATILSQTYDLVHDSVRNLLLFCGLEGRVRALDLAIGQVIDLTPRLSTGGLLSLALSPDRSVLCTQAIPAPLDRSPNDASTFRIWDYPRLLDSCAMRTR